MGGNIALAGNIVSHFFAVARTADQCAGLQIAVWEALEDGGVQPEFLSGHFQVHAGDAAIAYAANFYQAAGQDGDALYLQTGDDGGQSQLTPLN